jgi:hypothetical protein
MPLWVIRLSAGLLILAHEKIGPPFSGPKLLEVVLTHRDGAVR